MSPPLSESSGHDELGAKVAAQGEKVRELKANKAEKADVDAAVKALLDLKVGAVAPWNSWNRENMVSNHF